MNITGIGNAYTDTLIANGLKSVITKQENKSATKRDILGLKQLVADRYFPIKSPELFLVKIMS